MKAHNDAALARLRAVWWQPTQVHEIGSVPTSPVTPYAVVSTDSGLPTNYRVCGDSTSMQMRVVVQFFGKNFDDIANAAAKADDAFKGVTLSVPGRETTKCRRELATNITRDPDGGSLLGGLHTYLFTSNPTE